MSARSQLQPAFPGDDDVPKVCKCCGEQKTRRDFSTHATTRDRRQQVCRPCMLVKQKTSKERRRASRLPSYARVYRRKLRLEVLTHYGNGTPECACCREATFEFLSIDHVNGGGRRHRQSVGDVYRFLKRNGFPTGYRVLCHNCNNAIGAYGYCPHQKAHSPRLPLPVVEGGAAR